MVARPRWQKDRLQPRILVVEDDADTANVVSAAVAEGSSQVDIARSGEEALQRWTKERHDLLILDLKLPGEMDGIDVFQMIRKISGARPRAMIISGANEASDSARALRLPIVLKPFALEDLRATMRRALEM